jgi:hypothetical protein
MFSSISWSRFISFLLIVALLYYAVVVLLYFRKDVLTGIRRFQAGRPVRHQPSSAPEPGYFGHLLEHTMALCDQLREYLQKAAFEHTPKEACISDLGLLVRQHPMLNDTPFMVTINNLLIKELERHHITYLGVEEVDGLWGTAG